ncbi:hypothetical protein F2P79_025470 [Pimephales promelas]|nr:hypothetical protein F2P79_025470 [Pimephales promelas]
MLLHQLMGGNGTGISNMAELLAKGHANGRKTSPVRGRSISPRERGMLRGRSLMTNLLTRKMDMSAGADAGEGEQRLRTRPVPVGRIGTETGLDMIKHNAAHWNNADALVTLIRSMIGLHVYWVT